MSGRERNGSDASLHGGIFLYYIGSVLGQSLCRCLLCYAQGAKEALGEFVYKGRKREISCENAKAFLGTVGVYLLCSADTPLFCERSLYGRDGS